MVLNAVKASGKVASSPVFSSRYSLLIHIYDFDHLNDKVEKYESHDKMPQYFNYGFTASLKTMNAQANDNTYNLKNLLTSFNNDAELKCSEATHKAQQLKIKVEAQEQKIYKMQKKMFLFSLEHYEAENDILCEIEGRRLAQLKIKEECDFLEEITDKIYKRVSDVIFRTLATASIKIDQIEPRITQDTEKLFDYIFEYGKQLEIIENSEMEQFKSVNEEEENDDTDEEEEEEEDEKENEEEDDEKENEDEDTDIENEDTSNLDLEEEYKFYKRRTFELVDEKEELQRLNSDLKNELEEQKKQTEKFELLFRNTLKEQIESETQLSHLKIEMLSLLRKSK